MSRMGVDVVSQGWRVRLAEAVERDGRSHRELSRAAGLNPGYLHQVLMLGKSPTVDKLLPLCAALRVSAAWVLYGSDVTREDEELVRLLRRDPGTREALLALLRSRA